MQTFRCQPMPGQTECRSPTKKPHHTVTRAAKEWRVGDKHNVDPGLINPCLLIWGCPTGFSEDLSLWRVFPHPNINKQGFIHPGSTLQANSASNVVHKERRSSRTLCRTPRINHTRKLESYNTKYIRTAGTAHDIIKLNTTNQVICIYIYTHTYIFVCVCVLTRGPCGFSFSSLPSQPEKHTHTHMSQINKNRKSKQHISKVISGSRVPKRTTKNHKVGHPHLFNAGTEVLHEYLSQVLMWLGYSQRNLWIVSRGVLSWCSGATKGRQTGQIHFLL